MEKFTIKNDNVIKVLTFEEAVEDFKGMLYSNSIKMAKRFKHYEMSMFLEEEDYFQESLLILKKVLENFDVNGKAQFSTVLKVTLRNKGIDLQRKLNTSKRKVIGVEYISGIYGCEEGEIFEGRTGGNKEEADITEKMELDDYINIILTKEEKLMLIADINIGDIEEDPNYALLNDVLRDEIGKGRILKKDLCEKFGCSKPTLKKRTIASKEKLENAVIHYLNSESNKELFSNGIS